MVSFRQSMSPFRLLLVVAGTIVVLALATVAVIFSSAFQTWVARKAIASRPELRVTIGSVDAGLKQIELTDVRYERQGAVLTMPKLQAELPMLSAGFSERIELTRLVAKGWTLDLTKLTESAVEAKTVSTVVTTPSNAAPNPSTVATNPAPIPATPPPGASLPHPAANPAAAAATAFAGVFGHLRLPVDLSVDGVQLEGEVVLPDSRDRVKVTLRGGGLAAGREGRFDLTAEAALADPKVNAVAIRGTLLGAMDTARTFTQLAVKLDASASGSQFPRGVKLTAGLTAARAPTGETYLANIVTQERQLVALKADLPRDASRLDGTWKLDVRDVDLAPFALGQPLPAFTVVGEGKFDTNATLSAVHATGRLNATAGRLEMLMPELAAMGAFKIAADFDVAQRGDVITVQQLEATVSSTQPIATVTALQSFAFDPARAELRASDPARELIGVVLQGVPLAWTKLFLPGYELTGSDLRGELVALARAGGMTLRSRSPLAVDQIGIARGDQSLVREVDLELNVTADFTPQGWQAEVSGLSARNGSATVLNFDGKAGQLAAKGQPLKATGTISANLPALLEQPAAAQAVRLTSGDGTLEFVASLGAKKEIQARIDLRDLATAGKDATITLPNVYAQVRADLSADGQLAVNVPIVLERDARKSDLTLVGTLAPEKGKTRAIEAQVTSTQLVLEDATILAAMVPDAGTPPPDPKTTEGSLPFWAGLHGVVALQLSRVIYSEAFEMTNVGGRIRVDAGTLKFETVQAAMGETGLAALSGTVSFDPASPQPYGLLAKVNLSEFDPGPLLRALSDDQPPIVEGKFDVSSKLTGRADTLAELAAAAGGEFQVTSKGGVFRGLPVNAATLAENTSKIASWLASAGTALGALTGKKDYGDVANKAQAVAEVAKGLSAISYDQLSVVISRDAALNATLEDFTLISPELRLNGRGTATHTPDTGLLDDIIAMEFKLGAQGRQGELLKYLGALEPQTDDLGYAGCVLPLKVGGTIGQPDTTELNEKLATLALEKSGVTEKASELFNRIIGGGK